MHYYRVIATGGSVLIDRTLTYRTSERLSFGQVVRVPLRNRLVNAIVIDSAPAPVRQSIKEVRSVINGLIVPRTQLQLAEAVASYFVAPRSSVYSLLIPKNAHVLHRRMSSELSASASKAFHAPPPLSSDQSRVISEIASTPAFRTILLRGENASGKTRIYRELILLALKKNRSALLLVPEIGLTSQVVQSLEGLGHNVFVVHSTLSDSERYALWLMILQHPSSVIVGPRSALFYPLNNLGLIIVDECHDSSYHQDNTPKYHALRAARMLANATKCKLLLASATPGITDYYYSLHQADATIEVTRPLEVLGHHQRKIDIVDMTTTSTVSGRYSKILINAIKASLLQRHQVLLFHNRRGTSSMVACQKCGYLHLCPRCHHSLTHHHDSAKLLCHICGSRQNILSSCPSCGSTELVYRGFGTKKLEGDLTALFPEAKIARFDSDNKAAEKLNRRYDELRSGRIDIIIGTQIIAKGLDLPKLDLVAIPSVENLLYLPDFSASERFFQLIYQVTGRAGRHQDSRVIIQTRDPHNQILKLALKRDYRAFYDYELDNRRQFGYPPFKFLMQLTIERTEPSEARNAASALTDEIRRRYSKLQVLGPAPAFFERSARGYRWQLLIKSSSRKLLMKIASSLPRGWSIDIDPLTLI